MHNQVLPSIESVDGSDPLATLQNPMDRLEAKEEEDEDEDEDTEEDEEEDGEDTDLDDWESDPPRPFDPHDLCKCQLVLVSKGPLCGHHFTSSSQQCVREADGVWRVPILLMKELKLRRN